MPRFSFIVPFHAGLASLSQCLDALVPLPADSELIIAADGGVDDCRPLATRHRARVLTLSRSSGPAVARNAAAGAARGDVLVFIDADVVVSRAGLTRMEQIFSEQPHTAAVFGAYDERPADPGFVSQYKNLSHSFIHHSSTTRPRTFWAGFGAVRRGAFQAVGGFDERFDRPSVEDIDFGYRLTAAGFEVLLDPALSACHLKRWTIGSAIASDVRDRGIPWTQLIWRHGALNNELNLRTEYRLSVVLAYLALVSLVLAPHDRRFLLNLPPLVVGLTALNRRYYRFFYEKRGIWFAARVWVLHVGQSLSNGLSFAIGTVLFFGTQYLGLRLPGSLSRQSWNVGDLQKAPDDPQLFAAWPAARRIIGLRAQQYLSLKPDRVQPIVEVAIEPVGLHEREQRC
jgi:GT2 family glycosyltransferase